ncbi:MAG: PfkB family carbohydrate kinase [Candidatus Dormibacteraeota bacterium]|nr:PfkB family carbohydrate kinase [Candidatus Dormibacteraeota bacterium]
MAWDIAVAGTVHLDEITTPAGHRSDQLGGSAVYFALAAARYATVHLNGIVGTDRAPLFTELLDSVGVRRDGLVVSDTPTFRWHARHDFDRWVAVDTSSEEGCDPLWRPALGEAAAAAPVLFLASMRPALQGAVRVQSRARLIGADSMTEYTGPQRHAVRELVQGCDVLFLNESELASLTGAPVTTWRQEAIALCGVGRLRAVVVKGGPKGASLVTDDGVISRPPARVAAVVDPTGAGDALAGGFLGACAAAERDDIDYFVTALEAGLQCAAAAIGHFGLAGVLADTAGST